jgi:hypothetical protein
MQKYPAEYKIVADGFIEIEFEHNFDSQSTVIKQARNLTHKITMYQLKIDNLIYDSIQTV